MGKTNIKRFQIFANSLYASGTVVFVLSVCGWIIFIGLFVQRLQYTPAVPISDLVSKNGTSKNASAVSTVERILDYKVKAAPIITMFTTIKEKKCRSEIHNRTLSNWAALAPMLTPVLFVPENEAATSQWIVQAKDAGWDVRVTTDVKKNIPILTAMFKQVLHESTTPFVGFANADILFDHGIIATLQKLNEIKNVNKESCLIVGQRRNANITTFNLGSGENLMQISKVGSRLVLFNGRAQDYLIVSRKGLPWDEIPEFVVGRNGFDNWLVVMAQEWATTLIDASRTLLAVHQVGMDGIRSGSTTNTNETRNMNTDLVGDFPFIRGSTECAPYYTKHVCVNNGNSKGSSCNDVPSIKLLRRPMHLCKKDGRKFWRVRCTKVDTCSI